MSGSDTAQPVLRGHTSRRAPMAVLVLHGGKVASHARARPWHLSSVRMIPFTRALRRALGDTASVVQLQCRFRGWNGAERSPVADALWAIEQLRDRHGADVPIVLVGHSMGGRTAAAVAGHPNVTAVVALAPWWADGTETRTMRPGQHLLVLHGTADRWTDPVASKRATELAATRGVDARYVPMAGAGHFMLRSPWTWTATVRTFVRDQSRALSPTKTV